MMTCRACLAAWLLVHVARGFSVTQPFSPRSPSILNGRLRPKVTTVLSLATTISSNEDLKPGIATIDAVNDQIMGQLDQLRQTQNFRLYSVDILASCEYMPQELFECYSETCEIYPVDEEEVSVCKSHLCSRSSSSPCLVLPCLNFFILFLL